MRAKVNRYGTFLMLLDRFKNHIFYKRKRMKKLALFLTDIKNSSLFDEFTHERVEYNVFLFDVPLKGSNSLKTFKISLTFRFDKLFR
jgi:hypothetical protein